MVITTKEVHDRARQKALLLAQERYPSASHYKHEAFANSVATMVTELSGGFGGPSVREHAASYLYGGQKHVYNKAVDLLISADGPIFGELTEVHKQCWEHEYCFDDDPADIAELEHLGPNGCDI